MKTLRFALAATVFVLPVPAFAQTPCPSSPVFDHGTTMNGKPLASPPAVASTTLAGKAITLNYNAPSMRCRKIFGGLVPYDKVWRTGANPATTFVTAVDLKIGTLDVPAGTYTLFTLPETAPSSWILIVSNKTGEWGIPYPEGSDLGRTAMMVNTLPAPQEVMSISFEKTTAHSTELHIRWETTDAYVKLTAK
jgi:hypothetical protein